MTIGARRGSSGRGGPAARVPSVDRRRVTTLWPQHTSPRPAPPEQVSWPREILRTAQVAPPILSITTIQTRRGTGPVTLGQPAFGHGGNAGTMRRCHVPNDKRPRSSLDSWLREVLAEQADRAHRPSVGEAKRKVLLVVKPPKPVSEMTEGELRVLAEWLGDLMDDRARRL